MQLWFFLTICVACQVSGNKWGSDLETSLKKYYSSDIVSKIRDRWELHRRPTEHAIKTVLKETVGFIGMNVYIKKVKEPLAASYCHSDGQVTVLFKDIHLDDLPHCWLPFVKMSLASNLLRIETGLNKMILHTEYIVIRNFSNIISDPGDQNPDSVSPFLFYHVPATGKATIILEDCTLSGYIIATLKGESINLGYGHFRIINCDATLEIYRDGDDSPPVIAKYLLTDKDDRLTVMDLVMKALEDDLVPKLQAAMFSFVNTSSTLGSNLHIYEKNQEDIFKRTNKFLTNIVRFLNKLTIEENGGVLDHTYHNLNWDREINDRSGNTSISEETLHIYDIKVTGLDTAYCAHIGGPFNYEEGQILIGEEIRFSSLQVRGFIFSSWGNTSAGKVEYPFSFEVNDVVVDFQMTQDNERKGDKQFKLTLLKVVKMRPVFSALTEYFYDFTIPVLQGFILRDLPRLITTHMNSLLPKAIQIAKTSYKEMPDDDEKSEDYSSSNKEVVNDNAHKYYLNNDNTKKETSDEETQYSYSIEEIEKRRLKFMAIKPGQDKSKKARFKPVFGVRAAIKARKG